MLWFWGSIFLLALFAKVLVSWQRSAKGRKASLVWPRPHQPPAGPLCPPSPVGWLAQSMLVAGKKQLQAAQRRGSPYSHLNPSLLWGALLAGAGEMRRTGEGSRGNGWSCLASLAGLPSPSPTLYVSLEKLLRGGRHSNTEGPATGAASVGGSSTFCMSQQRKGGRSYPLCNVCIFQDVSEVHASKMWHIRAQKLE